MDDAMLSGDMEVISSDVKRDLPRQGGGEFMQGCISGVFVERESLSAYAFVDATKLAEEAQW
jgi:hypothetical protein